MRVILDTNILVAASRSRRGASFAIISKLPSQKFEIALTIPLYMEYQDALTRAEVAGKRYTTDEAIRFTRYLCSIAHKQNVFFLWRPRLKDPKDDMVLEAAIASGSQFIVTHNLKDFSHKGIEEQFSVHPISPKRFLEIIG